MSGGGGGTYVQDNSVQVEAMREQAARDEQARQDALKAQQEAQFKTDLANAVAGAKSTGENYATSRGLDPTTMDPVIDQIINDARLKVPDLDSNPGQYFTSDIFSTGFANAEDARRAANNTKVTNAFAPGFEKTYFGDTSDDAVLNAILGEQEKTAQQQLDYNRARGTLNDSGYNTALQKLSGQEAAAKSTLTGIGDSVLGKLRTGLDDIKSQAGSGASSWSFGMPDFDVGQYVTQANDYANTNKANLEGQIRSAVGSTQLFDIPSLLAAAGTAQGPINLTTVDKVSGTPDFSGKKSKTDRGLGSTGAF